MRLRNISYVVKNSWMFGQMAHSTVGRTVLKLILKLTPEKILLKQMNNLYSLNKI